MPAKYADRVTWVSTYVFRQAIANAFVELRDLIPRCRFRDCRHDAEPGCAVQAAVASGSVSPHRVVLLQSLLREARAAHGSAR
jgi:ribosome biogenesis GTPase